MYSLPEPAFTFDFRLFDFRLVRAGIHGAHHDLLPLRSKHYRMTEIYRIKKIGNRKKHERMSKLLVLLTLMPVCKLSKTII